MWKYYVLRVAYLILGRLPLRILYGIARVAGNFAYLWRKTTREAVASNMRHLLSKDASEAEVRDATRDVFRNASRYYADLIHMPHVSIKRFYDERFVIEGEEYLRDAVDSGRGAVVAGTHFGNPEMSVQPLAALGYSFLGLTEPLEPKALSDFTHWLRSQNGHIYRPLGYEGLKETIRWLRDGGLVAVLLDRDVAGAGVPMQFCGAEASIPLGAVQLALRTGADLIPAKSRRLPGYGFKIQVEPPFEIIQTGDFKADLRTNTERLLLTYEEQLRSDPGQWAVLEAIWKGQPHPDSEVQ